MTTRQLKAALAELHKETRKIAAGAPGKASPKGFRRLMVRVPAVRALVKNGYGFLDGSRRDILATWHYIFHETDLYEVACQAIYYYQHRSLNRAEFNKVRQWVNRCDCWEHSDDLSKIYAQVFEENPDWVLPWYRKWNSNKNPWKRRQSVVGLLEYAQKRKSVRPYKTLISFVGPLLKDDDYYVQKGVGWTLREIYNVYPKEALLFMQRNLAEIHPLAYSAATEKLNKATKTRLNEKRKKIRVRG